MNLKEKTINSLPIIPNGFEIYLFGSILSSNDCNDIDLAIIYDNNLVEIEEAIKLRKLIVNKISQEIELPVEILLLSKEENEQTEFISNLKTEMINASR